MPRAKCLIGLLSLGTALIAADPSVGTWKLNPAKSSGPGLPKEVTLIISEKGNNFHIAVSATSAAGTPVSYTFDVPQAGGEGQISGSPAFDKVSISHADNYVTDGTMTKAGKMVRTIHSVISRDGKSMTQTVKGTDVQGKRISASLIEIFEKQ
jgi:hypothetical protein